MGIKFERGNDCMVRENFDWELAFTKTYKEYRNEHIAIREVKCLETMFSEFFLDMKEGDLFAGRIQYPFCGHGTEFMTRGPLYFCHGKKIMAIAEESNFSEEYMIQLQDMISFWRDEKYIWENDLPEEEHNHSKMYEILTKDVFENTSNSIADMEGRMAGIFINYDELVQMGLPGLKQKIQRRQEQEEDNKLYEAMLMSLELLDKICYQLSNRAKDLADHTTNLEWKKELDKAAEVLLLITKQAPKTLREGLQLFWLYSLVAGTLNYGRMDVYLGDLYVNDIESGIITEEEALKLVVEMWKMITRRRLTEGGVADFNSRIIVGGRGRRNEKNADRFALLAMEASHSVHDTEPQLTLRLYEGQNSALMKKAMDVIGNGCIYPMLYNDDVNIPAVAKTLKITQDVAANYLPYGCGEYGLDHQSIGSPNCSLNLLKALEVVLHCGIDPVSGKKIGIQSGPIKEFDTFDRLFVAYCKQVEHHIRYLAERHQWEYQLERTMTPFLYISMLVDDCIKRGKAINDGGACYRGGIIESFGIVNTADSFYTIKKLVYEEKLLSLEEFVEILDKNYEGYEKYYRRIHKLPKYGNDDDQVDSMVQKISHHVCSFALKQAERVGFDYFGIVNINNFYNVIYGKTTAASADGRCFGEPLANGNTPTSGYDKKGITALLNSMVKVKPNEHLGYTQNMKFSKDMFNNNRKKTEMLLDTYFKNGGAQAMITVVGKDDLENAMKEPSMYQNLIVRVGGFSARFIELDEDTQMDILKRTLY